MSPTPLEGAAAGRRPPDDPFGSPQLRTKFDKGSNSSLKVADNDADVVHPLNRHIREHRDRKLGYVGEARRLLVYFDVSGALGASSTFVNCGVSAGGLRC